jgi:alkyl hydroperoxide reductase subunit AhpC
VLFSHPKDFTPVCTTELGYMARSSRVRQARREDHRLSVDPSTDHDGWAHDIEETQGARRNYPMIGDTDSRSRSSTACCRRASRRSPKRTAADNQTVRNVFVIGPDKKIKLIWSTR